MSLMKVTSELLLKFPSRATLKNQNRKYIGVSETEYPDFVPPEPRDELYYLPKYMEGTPKIIPSRRRAGAHGCDTNIVDFKE